MKIPIAKWGVLILLSGVAFAALDNSTNSNNTLEQKLKNYLSAQFENQGRVELERVYAKDLIPAEAQVISVDPKPSLGWVNFEVAWPDNGSVRRTFGTAVVKLYVPIAVAKTAIRNSESFTQENTQLQEREVSPFRVTGFYHRMENLQKLRARAYITPGSVISHQHTQIPFIVNSGESVALVRETPSIKVSLRVKALENGRENQWIRVENAHSKKVIQARVVQPGEVSLH